jgi:hypothetical protein
MTLSSTCKRLGPLPNRDPNGRDCKALGCHSPSNRTQPPAAHFSTAPSDFLTPTIVNLYVTRSRAATGRNDVRKANVRKPLCFRPLSLALNGCEPPAPFSWSSSNERDRLNFKGLNKSATVPLNRTSPHTNVTLGKVFRGSSRLAGTSIFREPKGILGQKRPGSRSGCSSG